MKLRSWKTSGPKANASQSSSLCRLAWSFCYFLYLSREKNHCDVKVYSRRFMIRVKAIMNLNPSFLNFVIFSSFDDSI